MTSVPRLALVSPSADRAPRAAEFFAGIGLVRLGLETAGFDIVWSNDIEPAKRQMYQAKFRDRAVDHTFVLGDIAKVRASSLPRDLALAWASFPCIDLSLAGWRRGINGSHSSTFWHFTRILGELGDDRPPVVAIENVIGFATSHGGQDLAAAVLELNRLGYSVDVLTLDARRFVAQSRPRLFLIGAQQPPDDDVEPGTPLRPPWLLAPFLDRTLRTHCASLPPPPPLLEDGLSSIIEQMSADDERWWDTARTKAFLSSLSPVQLARLTALRQAPAYSYRTAYRRTREGKAVWEIRPDDISGCLRTARGGSSKQALVEAGQGTVRVRWMTPREYARLMGAGDYPLDDIRRNQALFGFGDAVCVPVVTWLADHYLMPLVSLQQSSESPKSLAEAVIG